ncbi:MAG: leucine-rich repeat domain-containing protein, partial [Candidatus Adiutrix sp.]|nr:leucine-rich repeat domain-containing protein [Candidatus Adiutrix sp.]
KITNYAGLKGLYNLEYLDLSENKLEKVDMLDGLTSLEVLNLNKNPLSDASGLAQASRSLKEIYLDVSDINSLKWLEHLSGLNILSAKEAKLSGPIDLSFWPNLKRLDLSYNAITGLSGLANLPADFVGRIANNRLPLSSIYELMEDGKKSGRQWLFTMGGEKQGTLRELEVRRGVGDQNDVFEPQALKVGETLDLRTETHLGGRKTDFTIVEFDADNKERGFWKALDCALVKPGEKRGFGAPLPACLKDDAGITFWRAGRFKIRMENKAIVQPQTRLGIRLEEMCIAVISSLVTVR